jgi:hypothetical protein
LFDRPVMLPPGRARLATRPMATGSYPNTKAIGIAEVACLSVGAALSFVTMTSTLSRTNSAAISAMRSGRPSDHRCSMAMVRPSIQPSSRSRATKAAVHGAQAVASPPRNPIVGSLADRCARAASGHAATAPPINAMNSRRLTRSPRRRGATSQSAPRGRVPLRS